MRRRLPDLPRQRYEDWTLDDPAGQSLFTVRAIRDDIRAPAETLLASLPSPA